MGRYIMLFFYVQKWKLMVFCEVLFDYLKRLA